MIIIIMTLVHFQATILLVTREKKTTANSRMLVLGILVLFPFQSRYGFKFSFSLKLGSSFNFSLSCSAKCSIVVLFPFQSSRYSFPLLSRGATLGDHFLKQWQCWRWWRWRWLMLQWYLCPLHIYCPTCSCSTPADADCVTDSLTGQSYLHWTG